MLTTRPTSKQIEEAVYAQLRQVLEEGNNPNVEFDNDSRLNGDMGLSSMQLAQVVLDLENVFDCDPFAEMVSVTSVRTVGDLVKAYETWFTAQENGGAVEDDTLLAAQRRALQRQAR